MTLEQEALLKRLEKENQELREWRLNVKRNVSQLYDVLKKWMDIYAEDFEFRFVIAKRIGSSQRQRLIERCIELIKGERDYASLYSERRESLESSERLSSQREMLLRIEEEIQKVLPRSSHSDHRTKAFRALAEIHEALQSQDQGSPDPSGPDHRSNG